MFRQITRAYQTAYRPNIVANGRKPSFYLVVSSANVGDKSGTTKDQLRDEYVT